MTPAEIWAKEPVRTIEEMNAEEKITWVAAILPLGRWNAELPYRFKDFCNRRLLAILES